MEIEPLDSVPPPQPPPVPPQNGVENGQQRQNPETEDPDRIIDIFA
jgi:hypothetical protein